MASIKQEQYDMLVSGKPKPKREIAEMQEREDFINNANKLEIKGIRQMKKYMEGLKSIY